MLTKSAFILWMVYNDLQMIYIYLLDQIMIKPVIFRNIITILKNCFYLNI